MKKLSWAEKIGCGFVFYFALMVPFALLMVLMDHLGVPEKTMRLIGGGLMYSMLGLLFWACWNVQSVFDWASHRWQRIRGK